MLDQPQCLRLSSTEQEYERESQFVKRIELKSDFLSADLVLARHTEEDINYRKIPDTTRSIARVISKFPSREVYHSEPQMLDAAPRVLQPESMMLPEGLLVSA